MDSLRNCKIHMLGAFCQVFKSPVINPMQSGKQRYNFQPKTSVLKQKMFSIQKEMNLKIIF